MKKSIITTFLALAILVSFAMFEKINIEEKFNKFEEYIACTKQKIESGNFSPDESIGLENFWIKTKKSLHFIVPHNDIKEIDMWVFECTEYTRQQNFKEALCKLYVLEKLAKEIPANFMLSFENIF